MVGLDFLRRARRATAKPLVAIGGIDAGNLAAVLAAGADGAAVLGAVASGDVKAAAARLMAAGGGMKIFLTGFMGAGKTAVGEKLSERLGLPFADLDHEVEARSGLSVREIFALGGESEFRRREQATLAELAEQPDLVLAAGGGTVTVEANARLMKASWLHRLAQPAVRGHRRAHRRPRQARPAAVQGRGAGLGAVSRAAPRLPQLRPPGRRRPRREPGGGRGPDRALGWPIADEVPPALRHARQLGGAPGGAAPRPAQAVRRHPDARRRGRLRRRPQPGGRGDRRAAGEGLRHPRQPRQGGLRGRRRRELQPRRAGRRAVDGRAADPRQPPLRPRAGPRPGGDRGGDDDLPRLAARRGPLRPLRLRRLRGVRRPERLAHLLRPHPRHLDVRAGRRRGAGGGAARRRRPRRPRPRRPLPDQPRLDRPAPRPRPARLLHDLRQRRGGRCAGTASPTRSPAPRSASAPPACRRCSPTGWRWGCRRAPGRPRPSPSSIVCDDVR